MRISLSPKLISKTWRDGTLSIAGPSLAGYVTYIRAYEKLLRRLPAFNFIYAAPDPSKFRRTAAFFARAFGNEGQVDACYVVRYFQLRLLWETNRTTMLSRADRDFLRAGDKRYNGLPFASAFRKWASTGLSGPDIDALLARPHSCPERSFQTHVLPHAFTVFERFSKDRSAGESGTIVLGAGSTDGSALGSTLCER